MKRVLLFAIMALSTVSAWAHKDRILSPRPDGVIPEVPAEYRETRLHIEYAKEGKVRSMRFVSGGRESNVEQCVPASLPKASPRRLDLNGSWCHYVV